MMEFSARVLADSINTSGNRLTTMEWTYPRFVHAEILTHRMLSRNSASSRAIPASKLRLVVTETPVVPLEWLKEQKGMQGGPALEGNDALAADAIWLAARDFMVKCSEDLSALNVHKSLANRLIEPFMWITVLISATEWDNLWDLRCHPDAEQHFRKIAEMARKEYDASEPEELVDGEWHMPFIQTGSHETAKKGNEKLKKIATGRTARVSYLTHEGSRDPAADVELHDRLRDGSGGVGHFSPFEHVAQALSAPQRVANFIGWKQYRYDVDEKNRPLMDPKQLLVIYG